MRLVFICTINPDPPTDWMLGMLYIGHTEWNIKNRYVARTYDASKIYMVYNPELVRTTGMVRG